ncbi:outer membrane beta-barrel protein [uncultured Bacteroides sp.]|uniref:outer membrane beta-barrel protein n=1 Tax=uncultured Bacteroides sp. TaxID=162156 RepID=UPI00280B4C53|nr:outer membrane beta-barrel protein [uncultured Bacteroides sp.]
MKTCRLGGLLLLLFCVHTIMYAQQARTVRGRVQMLETGSEKKQPLPSASIVVLEKTDSTFVKGTASDKNGRFTLTYQAQDKKEYLLKVSFMGMQSFYRTLGDSTSINAGIIVLKDDDLRIGEVVVTGKLQEVVMEGDTTVINASAYKTPEGAYLEDLVKRIPGLVYNKKDHSLTYNGQPISEINVNGESFFSGDKKTALENLPANLISKLRVYDKKSKEEEFTGISSGEKKYVLDLQTKEELNKTWLTNATVGYGNNKKRDLEGQVNYFSKDGQNLSFIARSTNRYQNSTYKDNINNSIGMNMTHKFGKKFTLNGNVSYNLNRNGNITSMYQEQYLKTGNQYSASANEGNSKSRSINSSFMGFGKLDKRTQVHFNVNLGFSPNQNESNSQSASFDAPPSVNHERLFEDFESIPESIKVNRSENRSLSDGKSNNTSWTVGIMRRLNEKGTTIGVNIMNSESWGDNESFALSQTTYFKLEDKYGNDSVLYRNQYLDSPQRNNSWRVGVNFTQPVGKKIHFRAAYNWSTRYERDNRSTYDLASLTHSAGFGELPSGYETGYVDSLSNRSHSRSNGHDLNVGFNYSDDVWMFNASLGVTPQKRTIDRKVGTLHADTAMNIIDYQPMLWVGWQKKEKMRVNLSYDGRTRQPSLSALMPLTDNSNPLYITRGNPDLKQMFIHNIRLNFQYPTKGISANAGWQMEQNSVTQVMLYDVQSGGRETYPININGNWNTYGNADWWKRWGHFSLRLNSGGRYDNRVSMVNEDRNVQPEKSTTRDVGLDCEVRTGYQPAWGGLELAASWNYQYSLNSLNDNDNYTRYYNFRFDGYVDFPFGLQLRTDAAYMLRSGTNIQKGEDDEIVWNATATWRFLKEKKAELSAHWADILGRRKSFNRMPTADGFYEFRTQEIKGYFIVTFKYNFRLMM